MAKTVKIVAAIVGVLIVLVIGAMVAILVLVDPNDYKDEIVAVVEQNTGRQLSIPGDIELSVFPWLGISLGEVALSNAPGFGKEPFVRIAGTDVHIKLLPLLRKQVEIGTVSLSGLRLNLAINEQGVSNWQDLAGKPAEAAPAAEPVPAESSGNPALPIAALAIGGLEISDAQIVWDDRQTNAHYQIRDFALESGPIALAEPFDIELSFHAKSRVPEISAEVELATRATVDLDRQHYALQDIALKLLASGVALPIPEVNLRLQADVQADLAQQTASIPRYALQTLGLQLKGKLDARQILDAPSFAGTLSLEPFAPRELIASLGQPAPVTSNPKALSSASADLQFSGGLNELSIDQLALLLDETRLGGKAAVKDFANPAIRFELALDAMDVDGYMPPVAPAPAGKAEESKPADKTAPIGVPVEPLRTLNLAGNFKAGKLKINNLHLAELEVGVNADKGLVEVKPLRTKLYQGALDGSVALDARGKVPQFATEQRLAGVSINPLLKDLAEIDLIEGSTELGFKIASRGETQQQIVANLDGSGQFKFNDGAVKGINIAQLLREGYAKFKGRTLPPDSAPNQTDFAELGGSFTIDKGVVNNPDLLAKSPLLRIEGKGSADLNQESLDYQVKAAVVGTLEGQGGKELADLKGLSVPVRVRGPFAEPKVSVELKEVLEAKAKQEIERQKEKVEEKVEEKKEELEQRLEDEAKKKLKKLLPFR